MCVRSRICCTSQHPRLALMARVTCAPIHAGSLPVTQKKRTGCFVNVCSVLESSAVTKGTHCNTLSRYVSRGSIHVHLMAFIHVGMKRTTFISRRRILPGKCSVPKKLAQGKNNSQICQFATLRFLRKFACPFLSNLPIHRHCGGQDAQLCGQP